MSAVPPAFNPQTSFSTLAQQPISSTGLPGSELDGEFARAADSINQIQSRLSEIQRDDGKLRNGVVSAESLSDDVRNLFISSGANPITWAAGIPIAVGDLVSNPSDTEGTYLAIVAHTSSSLFSTDLSKWALIAAPPVVGTLYTNTFTGNGSTTVFTLTETPASKDNTQLFIDGIYQPKSFYSIDGTSLTITPAPASGSDIEVSIGVPSDTSVVTVADGAISASKLDTSAVTTVKIANGAVTEAKIADGAITAAKIPDGSIVTAKLANNSVTNAKIAQLSVTADKITDGSITSSKFAPLSVTAEKLANNGVTTTKVADNAITTAKIDDLAITSAKLAAGSVESAKLADNAVVSAKIAASAVTSTKLASTAVTAEKMSGAQTGDAPIFGARAWVNFDASRDASGASNTSNTNRFIGASGNVSSVLKTGIGKFTVTMTTALPDANYAVVGTAGTDTTPRLLGSAPSTQTTTQFFLTTDNLAGDSANFTNNSLVVFG